MMARPLHPLQFLQWCHDNLEMPWLISVDAADAQFFPSPLFDNTTLMQLGFGVFIDSAMAPNPDHMQVKCCSRF
jgi:hypothetical protein